MCGNYTTFSSSERIGRINIIIWKITVIINGTDVGALTYNTGFSPIG